MHKKISLAIDTTFMDDRTAKGTAVFIREFVSQLDRYKDEFDITLVHRKHISGDDLYKNFNEEIIKKIPFPKGSMPLSELVFFLTTKKRYDIYYFAYPKLSPFFFLAPAKHIVNMQYDGGPDTVVGIDLMNTKGKINGVTLPLMRKFVDAFVTTSKFGKKGLVENRGLKGDKIHVAYGGANPMFKPIPKENAWEYISQEYSISMSPFIIASGRLTPHKNILRLIEAYDILRTKFGIQHKMIITGGVHMPDYSEAVMQLIKDRQLSSEVKILKVRHFEEMPYFYSAADLMVFPSLYEGFGLPLIEAMKCGVATVASYGSSLIEVGGDATKFFDPLNSHDMAEKMNQVLKDNEIKNALIKKGFVQAEKFTWEQHADRIIEICKQLCRQ